jgi:RHS repeat-associated protein
VSLSTGLIQNPFQFTGREFDPETGLNYNRARYYDPMAGRFLSGDPIGFEGDINFYEYAENDPVSLSDPRGQRAQRVPTSNPGELIVIDGGKKAGSGILKRLLGLLAGPAEVAVMVLISPEDGGASQELDFEARNNERERCSKDPKLCQVGRWMNPSELADMQKTGRVQQGA